MLRIGFIWTTDPRNRDGLSGMPWHMARALEGAGHHLEPITLAPPASKPVPKPWRRAARILAWKTRTASQSVLPARARARLLEDAFRQSAEVDLQASRLDLDLLFGCCASRPLARITTTLPLVYFTDTTARLIFDTYPEYRARSRAYQRVAEELEQHALDRADASVLASTQARRSAIEDYRVDPSRAFAVPMGANVVPDGPPPTDVPTRDDLKLCIIASEPVRKRVDLCVDIRRALADRGWNATLTVIGHATRRARHDPGVRCVGTVRKDDPTLANLIGSSHVMLLPSLGEAFGIAPCEAAHFGRPSVVSDVGGLPDVVIDDESGRVVPAHADADTYADAVLDVVERYGSMRDGALRRAHDVLSWDRWASAVTAIMDGVLERHADPEATRVQHPPSKSLR